MITALMLTKSWESIHAKYGAPETENTPAHVEESIEDLDQGEVMLEKQGLRYDADFLRRMMPVALDPMSEHEDMDSETESDSDAGRSDELDEFVTSEVGYSMSQCSTPSQSVTGPPAIGLSNSFRPSATPSPSTPNRKGNRQASASVSLTPSMASRFQKKLRPTQRRNYKE